MTAPTASESRRLALKKGYKALIAEANALVAAVSPEEAAARASSGGSVLIDLRDIRELDRFGRVEGAFHCPRGMLEFWIDPDSPYHKDIFAQDVEFVFFCAAGWRSALAGKTALEMGLPQVAHMDGGYKAWSAWRAAQAPLDAGDA